MRLHTKTNKKLISLVLIALFSICLVFSNNNHILAGEPINTENKISTSSLQSNSQIIEDVLNDKVADYNENGYFSQLYSPSLQGTYYALYILQALDRLDLINQTAITNYILDQFNENYNIFMDDYAFRYLDADFNLKHYPLTSILEINSYAILSLQILNKLDLVNNQSMVDFIWSCFDSSIGGFIGQTYDPNLKEEFKIAILDNTYYAVKTLDLIMENWNAYTTERNAIINYINSLQTTISVEFLFGGFFNDNQTDLDTLNIFEPNILSCYYAIKTLEIFNMVGTIQIDDFNQYLNFLYEEDHDYFDFTGLLRYANFSNLAATSIGLDLSIKTGNTNIDTPAILDFLINNRNEFGIWDISTSYNYHELIDTFQVIRSLKESGNLNILTPNNKDEIANALNLYRSYRGYSFTSNSLTRQELINSLVSSLELYNRISDLEIHELYKEIELSYFELGNESRGFYSYMNVDGKYFLFRTYPIEYYNLCEHNYVEEINYISSPKNTYMALNSLEKLFKLDDFESYYDLEVLLNSTIKSQFLEESSDYFGGFLSFLPNLPLSIEKQEKMIFFENAYYAVKVIEYLSRYLGIGDVSSLLQDKTALLTYLVKNIVETATTMYYNPDSSNKMEIILQDTYFLIDMLNVLGESIINEQKIKTFVLENIDYINIKNIYYCYKIDKILNLGIDFNYDLTHSLVKEIYREDLNDFYISTKHNKIDSEILYWICYMAKVDELEVGIDYNDPIFLHSQNNINVSINNIILEDYGPYSIVKFESQQIGTVVLNKQEDNSYKGILSVPLNSECYPFIYTNISLYEGTNQIFSKEITLDTTYGVDYTHEITKNGNTIKFEVNSSLITGYGRESYSKKHVFMQIYLDGDLINNQSFTMIEGGTWNYFIGEYQMIHTGNYTIELYLDDGINSEPIKITTYNSSYSIEALIEPTIFMMPLGIFMIGMPGTVIAYTSYQKNKKK